MTKLLNRVVVEHLLSAIHDGSLRPGQSLEVELLSDWLGFAPDDLTDAAFALVHIGVVDFEDDCLRVAVVDRSATLEALDVWVSLCCELLDEVVPRVDRVTVGEMRWAAERFLAAIESWDESAMGAASFDFYAALVAASDNITLQGTITRFQHFLRFSVLNLDEPLDVLRVAGVHEALCEAVATRDLTAARAVVQEAFAIRA